jgi:hypothetical protein
VAPGAFQQAADPTDVLDQERLVQSQPGSQGRQGFRGGIHAQDDLGRVAGQNEQYRKDREGNQEKYGRQGCCLFDQIDRSSMHIRHR